MSERCEGCGGQFESRDGPTHRYMLSSPGCWARYGEILAALSTDRALEAALVMCVDAYAVQHPGTPNPQAIQSVAVHLINMHGYLLRGRAVSPPRLTGHKGAFHWLMPPVSAAARTVLDMPTLGTPAELRAGAHSWVSAVWTSWAAHHAQIDAWAARFARS